MKCREGNEFWVQSVLAGTRVLFLAFWLPSENLLWWDYAWFLCVIIIAILPPLWIYLSPSPSLPPPKLHISQTRFNFNPPGSLTSYSRALSNFPRQLASFLTLSTHHPSLFSSGLVSLSHQARYFLNKSLWIVSTRLEQSESFFIASSHFVSIPGFWIITRKKCRNKKITNLCLGLENGEKSEIISLISIRNIYRPRNHLRDQK